MRLLIVATTTYTSPYHRGRLDELAERVESLDVIAGDVPTMWGRHGAASSSDRYRLHLLRPRFDRFWVTIMLEGLREVATAARPTLVHVKAEPWQLLTRQALGVARELDVPAGVELMEHGPRLRGPGGWLRRAVARRALGRCAYAMSSSQLSTRVALELRPELPVACIPGTGIRAVEPYDVGATDLRRWFGEGERSRTLAFVGRFAPEKGIREFMPVCDAVRARLPIGVAIAGGGPLAGEVTDWAASRPWVRVHGLIERTDVPSLLGTADLVVVPSVTTRDSSEQLGMAAVEAMGVGTPVLAYDSGALREVVGDGGVVVPEGDRRALAAAIEALLAAPPEEQELLRRRALERARLFTDEVLAARMVEFWRSLSLR